jgi:catechol 2,3-dioxygenase-like lactoylglutathione lyase family enzyme
MPTMKRTDEPRPEQGASDERAFESLDYVYWAAPELESSIAFYTGALGGELLWRIRDGETWVAAVRLTDSGPPVLLANHLEPGRGLLVFRVRSLEQTRARLLSRGWALIGAGEPLELPPGPCLVLEDPGHQRLAVYERVRPEMDRHFLGRYDTP